MYKPASPRVELLVGWSGWHRVLSCMLYLGWRVVCWGVLGGYSGRVGLPWTKSLLKQYNRLSKLAGEYHMIISVQCITNWLLPTPRHCAGDCSTWRWRCVGHILSRVTSVIICPEWHAFPRPTTGAVFHAESQYGPQHTARVCWAAVGCTAEVTFEYL